VSRDLTVSLAAAFTAQSLRGPVLFFEGEFSDGTLRLWSGLGPISWNGHTWTGAGNLLGMSEVKETAGIVAAGGAVSEVPAVDDRLGRAVDLGRKAHLQRRPAEIRLGVDDHEAVGLRLLASRGTRIRFPRRNRAPRR